VEIYILFYFIKKETLDTKELNWKRNLSIHPPHPTGNIFVKKERRNADFFILSFNNSVTKSKE